MTNYIEGMTALITGATSGIGKQLAFDLSKINVSLILIARNQEKLEIIKNDILKINNITVHIYSLDIQKRDHVQSKMEKILKYHTVDILVNNAGLALGSKHIDKGNIDNWENMIDTNIKGLLYVSRAIIPQMRLLDTAHIINIGSVAGKTAYENCNIYCATKAAVHSLGEGMNADLYGTNIKVTTIAPGAVKTNFSSIRFNGDIDKAQAVYENYIPLSALDISNIILNTLNTPRHVNIQYIDVMPLAQRNPHMLYKKD